MESPKNVVKKEKMVVLAKNSKKWLNFGILTKMSIFDTYGHKIKIWLRQSNFETILMHTSCLND